MFINAVKDYLEFLNNLYASFSTEVSLPILVQQSFFFILTSIKFIIVYIISFQWARDFSQFPLILPKINSALLSENLILESFSPNIFSFLQPPFYDNNKFFIGLLNSFFLSLPFSIAHLIALRRIIIQGYPAGIAAFLGTIVGQITLIASILFGFRFLILPWFGFEFVNHFIGLILLVTMIYDIIHLKKETEPISYSDKKTLLKYFALNFGLTWTEQASIFQYLGNISVGVQPTLLELSTAKTQIGFFSNQAFYVLGLGFGNFLFSSLFVFLITNLLNQIYLRFSSMTSKQFKESLNFGSIITIIGLSMTSIPYYSLDYLLAGPLGFVSQDKALEKVQLNYSFSDIKNGFLQHLISNQQLSIMTDISLFDRNDYLKAENLDDSVTQTFENLNYEGEYFANTTRDYSSQKLTDRDQIDKLQKSLYAKNYHNDDDIQENSKNSLASADFANIEPEQDDYFFSKYEKAGFQNFFYRNVKDSIDWVFLKQKYYSNALYKSLLKFDIDLLLDRQPRFQQLTPTEETQLFKNRFILAKYYDSLRDYRVIPYSVQQQSGNENFEDQSNMVSQSYVDRVYNHQFKGTLNVVRRLFHITLPLSDSDINNKNSNKTILKFDQPLYNEFSSSKNIFLHEELSQSSSNSSFIKETNPIPFYVGWDENLRKLVITNKYLSREFAGIEMKNEEKLIRFNAWPIPKNITHKDQKFPFVNIFEHPKLIDNFELNYLNVEMDKIPAVKLQTQEGKLILDLLPPNTGGFVWPGQINKVSLF